MFGTPDERAAVRKALEALKAFNEAVVECALRGIKCELSSDTQDSRCFVGKFTKTTIVLP